MKSPEEEPTEHRVHDRGLGCWEMRWTVSGGSDKETCEFWGNFVPCSQGDGKPLEAGKAGQCP